MKRFRIPLGLAALVFAVDLFVVPRDICNYRDSLEVVGSSLSFEAAHPPGFPLSILLNKIFSVLFGFIDSPYHRLALANSLYGVAALCLLYACLQQLTKDVKLSLAGTLLLAFSYSFWLYRIIPELFMLANLSAALSLWLLLKWRDADETERQRYWILFASSVGVGLVLHFTTTLWWPGFAWIFFTSRPRNPLRLIAIGVGFGLAGLLPFSLVYVMAARPHHALWGNIPTWSSFWQYLMRTDYGGLGMAGGIAKIDAERWPAFEAYLKQLFYQWGPTPVAFLGSLWAMGKGRRYIAALPLTVVIAAPVFLLYGRFRADGPFYLGSAEPLYLPSMAALMLASIVGLHAFIERAPRLQKPALAVLALLAIVQLAVNFRRVDRSHHRISRDLLGHLTMLVPENALMIINGDRELFPLLYGTWIEQKPRGGAVVVTGFAHKPEYHLELQREFPDLIVNDALIPSEFIRRLIIDNHGKRPIFIAETKTAFVWGLAGNPFYLRPSGKVFQVVREKAEVAAGKIALPFADSLADPISEHNHWDLTLLAGYRVTWREIGEELAKLGSVERAREYFSTLAELDPGTQDWTDLLAQIETRLPVYEGERWASRSFEEIDAAGMEAVRAQQHDRALALFMMAFQRKPDAALVANKIAVVCISAGDPKLARPYAQKAVELEPANEKFLSDLDLVETLLKHGDASGR